MSLSLSVCFFLNSSEMVNPNELKFGGMISLGVQMVLGKKTFRIRPTVCRKTVKTLTILATDPPYHPW